MKRSLMRIERTLLLPALLFVAGNVMQGPRAAVRVTDGGPVLVNTCLITAHVEEMVDFYRRVLQVEPRVLNDGYAEFATGVGVLALFSAAAQEAYIPGSAPAALNRSAILEFKVAAVDNEYTRLGTIVTRWVKRPATTPWGTRSFYFRDPDGNLVDFWMPAERSTLSH